MVRSSSMSRFEAKISNMLLLSEGTNTENRMMAGHPDKQSQVVVVAKGNSAAIAKNKTNQSTKPKKVTLLPKPRRKPRVSTRIEVESQCQSSQVTQNKLKTTEQSR